MIKYIFLYLIASAAVYFGCYGILVFDQEKMMQEVAVKDRVTEHSLISMGKTLGFGTKTEVQDLEDKMALFFVYWPIAVKYVYRRKVLGKESFIKY